MSRLLEKLSVVNGNSFLQHCLKLEGLRRPRLLSVAPARPPSLFSIRSESMGRDAASLGGTIAPSF